MPRLTHLRGRRRDRGAASVWVAVFMIPFLVVAALGIDVGAMHADQQRLQTGADAAALAVAQQCAVQPCTPAMAAATAQELASANAPMVDAATARIDDLEPGWVEVSTSSERDHWFAPVMGIDETDLGASSAAAWGYPIGGSSVLPFALSWCELSVQAGFAPIRDARGVVIGIDVTNTTRIFEIHASKTSPGRGDTCTGPNGLQVPGGFGWLEPTDGCGSTVTDLENWAPSDPGNTPPHGCEASDFTRWIGQVVYVPVFELKEGGGNNARYSIFGYVAFELLGYYFSGQYRETTLCSGNERCIVGRFLRYADIDSDFDFSADGPRLGATVVQLRLPEQGGS